MNTPALGTDEFTDHIRNLTLDQGIQAEIDLAVLRDHLKPFAELLNNLSRAMDDVRRELCTDEAKANAEGRSQAYSDAARMFAERFARFYPGQSKES